MRSLRLAAFLVSTVVLAGCEFDHFEIEIQPDGDGFERSLTAYRVTGSGENETIQPLDEEQRKRIGDLYKQCKAIEGGKKDLFTGRFTDKTPADVGGAGSYTHWTSPLGTLTSYIERFRGNDDLKAQLDARLEAADRFVDLVIGWMESELGEDPRFGPLKEFLEKEFRQDVRNLPLYAWTVDAMPHVREGTSDVFDELTARSVHYFYERSYFAMEDIPTFLRAFRAEGSGPLMKHIQRLICRKMGVADDRPIPKSLAFLADERAAAGSWDNYIRSTEEFKRRMRQWEEAKKTNPEAEKPDPSQPVRELGMAMLPLLIDGEGGAAGVQVTLHCDERPVSTNGKWQENDKVLIWKDCLHLQSTLPAFAFASWTRPDRKAQQKHFGRVLLAGDDLAQYVLWYRGLSEAEARQWDRLIARCRPGERLKSTLGEFRFNGDSKPDPNKPDEEPASLADTPRKLILDALGGEGSEK